jgi:hypothetical protein
LGFSCQDANQNPILTAVLDPSVMDQQLIELFARVFSKKEYKTLLLGKSLSNSDN